jgi:hypothetical protein
MSIVQAIFDRNYDHAGKILEESFINLLERKMCEAKKRVAAKMVAEMPNLPSVEKAKDSLSEAEKFTNRVEPAPTNPYGDLSGVKDSLPLSGKFTNRVEPPKTNPYGDLSGVKDSLPLSGPKEKLDKLNRDKKGYTVVEEEELHEGRIRIIKARMRNGKIQRRKKVSNVPGMKLIGGQLKRMTASERRARKLGAKKAARTGRGKRSQALRRRKMTLAKKSRLGI